MPRPTTLTWIPPIASGATTWRSAATRRGLLVAGFCATTSSDIHGREQVAPRSHRSRRCASRRRPSGVSNRRGRGGPTRRHRPPDESLSRLRSAQSLRRLQSGDGETLDPAAGQPAAGCPMGTKSRSKKHSRRVDQGAPQPNRRRSGCSPSHPSPLTCVSCGKALSGRRGWHRARRTANLGLRRHAESQSGRRRRPGRDVSSGGNPQFTKPGVRRAAQACGHSRDTSLTLFYRPNAIIEESETGVPERFGRCSCSRGFSGR